MRHDHAIPQTRSDRDQSEARTVDAVHEVADVCRDAQELLAVAASRLKGKTTTEICSALSDMARRHADMVDDLREEAVRLGGKRTETGTLSGTARRLYAVGDAALSDDESEPDTLLCHLSRMEERAAVRIRQARVRIDVEVSAEKVDGVLGRIELARAGIDSLLGNRPGQEPPG